MTPSGKRGSRRLPPNWCAGSTPCPARRRDVVSKFRHLPGRLRDAGRASLPYLPFTGQTMKHTKTTKNGKKTATTTLHIRCDDAKQLVKRISDRVLPGPVDADGRAFKVGQLVENLAN